MNDIEKFVETLAEIGIPHSVEDTEDGEYTDVVVNGEASDMYVVFVFKDGKYSYCG